MEITSKWELGVRNGKASRYGHYRFICRLYIPAACEQAAILWLHEREAKILNTRFEELYLVIIFATSNRRLLKSIQSKYKGVKVDARFLYKEVRGDEEESEEDLEAFYHSAEDEEYHQGFQDEYYHDIQREVFDYSNAMVDSSENGWFYSDPEHSSYKTWRLDHETGWD